MKKTYIYTRFTTGQQREESHEAQERKVRQLFDRLGIPHNDAIVINESAERGDDDARKAYEEFLAAIRRGEVGNVGADEQGRLSRGLNVEGVLKDIVFHGGRFVSCDGIDTDQPGWEDLAGIKQIHNRMEIRVSGSRVRRSQEQRVEKPDGSAGDYPYGYTSEYENPEAALKYTGRGPKPAKRVIKEPAAAALVLEIFEQFGRKNQSMSKLARWWEANKAQYPPITKTRVLAQHIRRILANTKYIGVWKYGTTTTLRDGGGKKKRAQLRPYQNAVVVERPNLRIVPQDLWEEVQEKLAKLKEQYGMRPQGKKRGCVHGYLQLFNTSPTAGNYYCHLCDTRMQVVGSSSGLRQLGCPKHISGTCAMSTHVKFDAAEAAVIGVLANVLTSYPDWLAAVIKSMRAGIEDLVRKTPDELARSEQRHAELGREIRNLVNYIKKHGDAAEVSGELQSAKNERDSLGQKIAHLRQAQSVKNDMPDDQWVREQLKDLQAILRDGKDGAAQLVRKLVVKITAEQIVAPGKKRGYIRLHFRIDGWAAIRQVLSKTLPRHVLESLKPASTISPADGEYIVTLGAPTQMDKWAPQIVQWRREGVKWTEIAKRTGLKLANAYTAYKRYVRGSEAA